MLIYFSCSVRGGRQKEKFYEKVVQELKKYGNVLNEEIAKSNLEVEEIYNTPEQIYNKDIGLIKRCDIVFAEVTVPSLGVGYELAYVEKMKKKVVCIKESNKEISAMIIGNKNFKMINYNSMEDLTKEIQITMKNKEE